MHTASVSGFYFLFLVFALDHVIITSARNLVGETVESSAPVPSILIFGDSTADPGNNNYISTPFKSNFWPYGKDFVNHTPTGRFTNGRLANDYIASYVGIKEFVPPYLDPTLSIEELMTGVSFASAGSGFDPLTPTISNVIPLSEQLKYLKEYKAKLEGAIGKGKTEKLMNNALFIVSAATNDFVVNYFGIPIRRKSYTIPSYMNFVLQEVRNVLQGLYDEGARRIGVVGLPPMGCLPIVITLYSDHPILNRDCIDKFSSIARDYNRLLKKELNATQPQLQASRIAYIDIYGPIEEMALGHHGFEDVNSGCCGTGMMEASFLCNLKSPVCADANEYVFWDSIHPTQRSYQLVVQSFSPVIDYLVSD